MYLYIYIYIYIICLWAAYGLPIGLHWFAWVALVSLFRGIDGIGGSHWCALVCTGFIDPRDV